MSIYALPEKDIWFPSPYMFDEDGDVVAIGGDLRTERLLAAYSQGIFPWYNEPDERLWWSPVKRCVLFHNQLKISKSMRNVINQNKYRITMDTAFGEVLEGCRGDLRVGNTWLIDEMVEAYTKLFNMGIGHSVEVWENDKLVGGLYGLSLGRMFFGENMFSRKPNTSKLAFIILSQYLKNKGWNVLDCQVVTDHLQTLGATGIPREDYLKLLAEELTYDTVSGKWTNDFVSHTSTF